MHWQRLTLKVKYFMILLSVFIIAGISHSKPSLVCAKAHNFIMNHHFRVIHSSLLCLYWPRRDKVAVAFSVKVIGQVAVTWAVRHSFLPPLLNHLLVHADNKLHVTYFKFFAQVEKKVHSK